MLPAEARKKQGRLFSTQESQREHGPADPLNPDFKPPETINVFEMICLLCKVTQFVILSTIIIGNKYIFLNSQHLQENIHVHEEMFDIFVMYLLGEETYTYVSMCVFMCEYRYIFSIVLL